MFSERPAGDGRLACLTSASSSLMTDDDPAPVTVRMMAAGTCWN